MDRWQNKEIETLYKICKDKCSSIKASEKLKECGFDRSPSAIRHFWKRQENKLNNFVNLLAENKKQSKPKILILDIETLPIQVYSWGIFKQVLSDNMIIKDSCVLSWAAKWFGKSTILGDVLTPKEAIIRDDKRILKGMHSLLEECDVVIAHNGDNFDVKILNGRFLLNGMTPPSPYQTIDTLKQSRKNFKLTTNKLNYISKLLFRKEKLSTNFDLWRRCDNGNSEALSYMFEYNKEDVVLLENVYKILLPWIKNHPNHSLYRTEFVCVNCGSEDIEESGHTYTSTGKYKVFRCNSCGGFSKERTADLNKENKECILGTLGK